MATWEATRLAPAMLALMSLLAAWSVAGQVQPATEAAPGAAPQPAAEAVPLLAHSQGKRGAAGQTGLPALQATAAGGPAAEGQGGWQFQPLVIAAGPAGEASGGWAIQEVVAPAPASPAPSAPQAEAPTPPLPALPGVPGTEPTAAPWAELLPALLAPAPGPPANETAPPETCWVQAGVDFPNGDLNAAGNASCCINPGDCCRLCWDTPGCGAWTFRAVDVSAVLPSSKEEVQFRRGGCRAAFPFCCL